VNLRNGITSLVALSPIRLVMVILFAALAVVGVERGVASVASSGPITERDAVWGDWGDARFGPFTTNLSGTITWSVVNPPGNTTADFGINPGQTATPTIYQATGTRGPDVARSEGAVVPYSFTIRASNGSDNQDFPVTFTISPRPVSIEGAFSADQKTYDDLFDATISPGDTLSLQPYDDDEDLFSGVIGTDVTLNAVATFDDENVGTQTVDLESSTLDGPEKDNYVLRFTDAPTAEADINAKPLTLVFGSVTKEYDGLTSVTVATPTLSGVETEDEDTVSVTGSPTWSFADKNVGTNKPLTLTGSYSLTGASSGNYSIATPTLTGDITTRTLTIQVSVTTREYNRTNTAILSRVSDDRVSGDIISLSFANGTFAQATPGTGIAVTPGAITASGADADNYTYVIAGGVTGTIEQKTLTLGGTFTVTTRDYDRTQTATGDTTGLTLIGVEGEETVSLDTATLRFASPNAGTHTVSITAATVTGADVANYRISVSGSPTASGTIDPLLRTVTATNTNKVYDGTTTASPTLTITPLGVDTVLVSGTATFADANVANGIAISITDISVDNSNYTVDDTLSASGNITPKQLTITGINGVDKVYDGNTTVSVTFDENSPALSVVEPVDQGDANRLDLVTANATFEFADPNAGEQDVTITGYELEGLAKDNYTLVQPNTVSATITPKTLRAVPTIATKTYDRSVTATISGAVDLFEVDQDVSGIINPDEVSVGSVSVADRFYDDRNAGTNKTVTVRNLTLTGEKAANYQLESATVTVSNGVILKRTLTFTTASKTYNGKTTGSVIIQDDSFDDDNISASASAVFEDPQAGTSKTITSLTNFQVNGSADDKNNYTWVEPTITTITTGTINKREIRVDGLTAQGKVYDAKGAATVTGTATLRSGDIQTKDDNTSDTVTLDGTPTFTFTSIHVGSRSITIGGLSLGGADANNYTVVLPSLSASITRAPLTIDGSFTANDRDYVRGNLTASIATNALELDGIQTNDEGIADAITLNTPTVQFADANAGEDKEVSISAATLSGDLRNNYTLSVTGAPKATGDADIRPKTLSVTVSANNKVYDGDDGATTTTPTLTGVFSGDQVTVTVDSAAFSGNLNNVTVEDDKKVSIELSLGGDEESNYTLASPVERTANITPKRLTIDPDSVTAENKPYDQSTSATVVYPNGGPTLVDVLSDDTVTVKNQTRTYTFADATAGTEKSVSTSGYALDGADASNYSLTSPDFLEADITQLTVTPTFTVDNKIYNGSNDVESSTLGRTGVLVGDTVTISSGTRTFSDKNVGDQKTVTAPSLSLGGDHEANYTLSVTSVTAKADITPFRLTLTPSATNKTYDGNTDAVASFVINKFGSDKVSVAYESATFDNKNVLFETRDGNGTPIPLPRPVEITGVSLAGDDAANYLLPFDTDNSSEKTTFQTEATIGLRALKASGFTANPKDYDGTTAATFSTTTLTLGPVTEGGLGVVAGDEDEVEFENPAGSFDSRNAGTPNARLQNWSLVGDAADNYTIDVAASLVSGEIRPINLSVTMTATSRTYNGNNTAVVAAAIDTEGLVQQGDTTANISVSNPTGTFDNKNVGTAKAVTVDPATVTFSGSLAGNYIPVFTNPTADITARALVWTVNATSREYDGTTDVVYSLSDNRISGDTFTINSGTGSFATAARGNGKTVTVTGISITDGDAANYTVPSTATGTANITHRTITVTGTFTAANKVYERNTSATVTSTTNLALGNIASGDSFTIASATATFDDRNVADGKTVTLAGLTISGVNSTNYLVNVSGVSTTTANITPLELTPAISVDNKRWDGTTTATIDSITVTALGSDSVDVSASSAEFQSASQGSGITVSISGISLGGDQAGNYTISPTATTTANITGEPLTVTITASTKEYDGNTLATVSVADTAATSDDITISHSPAQFQTRSVGTGITVTIRDIVISGTDAEKYVLANAGGIATTTADITAKPLAIAAESKVYDQLDTATVALDGVVSGDTVTFTSTSATFDDENVGNGKTVTAQGLTLGGTHGGNYSINATETTTADITPKPLALTFTPDPPVSDVASNITVTIADDRITGDTLTVSIADASTVRRGNQLVLVITGITLTGTDAPNYLSSGSFELVIRVFPSPQVPRSTVEALPETNTSTPAPRAPRPSTPSETAPTVIPPGITPVPPETGVPDILPGWRPPSSSRATIDFGAGVLSRETNPREIAEQIKVEAPQVISSERFGGFAPGVTTQLEIMGARTIGTIEIGPTGSPTAGQLEQALQDIPSGLAPSVPRVFPATTPAVVNTPTQHEIELLQDALTWLGLPEATRGPGLAAGNALSEVVWQVEGFRPGSAVFLVATSEPSLVAWGIAGDNGAASLRGYILDTTLPAGEHRFRVVGTAVLDDIETDDTGSITIGQDLSGYLNIFDDDTRVSVALWGGNSEGADHVAVRYIDPTLVQPAPVWWWLLIPTLLLTLVVLWRRRRGQWNRPGPTAAAVVTGGIFLIPAILVGTFLGQGILVPWALGVGIVATIVLLVLRQPEPTRRPSPAT